ncbi:hypothetical protein Ocin01_15414 [Orchesella cincta]|uniref:RING-type domain-containing protein n=1 Tax=Orchesella cincta TaxID=48709 RepID=A0A1D2MEI8_ORCCI|nr:hypothetical protein Ocin01_15414 [Orchesella cincta]
MECAICWIPLSEPMSSSSPPDAKRCKSSKKQKSATSSGLCTTPCGHIFHRECLMTWLNLNSTCPSCRNKVQSRKLYPVYLPAVEKKDDKKSANTKPVSKQTPNLAGGDNHSTSQEESKCDEKRTNMQHLDEANNDINEDDEDLDADSDNDDDDAMGESDSESGEDDDSEEEDEDVTTESEDEDDDEEY